MERREFLAALGAGTVALTAAAPALGQPSGMAMDMHPPKYPALEESALHCVMTSNDCLRHCIGMLAMKDYAMTGCINTAYQVTVACSALHALAAVNSPAVPAFAKAVAEVNAACQKECEKYPDVAECKACAEACKANAEECGKVAA
jgi:Cys-rich four helix bundle protein (predicted Tat secretion target)